MPCRFSFLPSPFTTNAYQFFLDWSAEGLDGYWVLLFSMMRGQIRSIEVCTPANPLPCGAKQKKKRITTFHPRVPRPKSNRTPPCLCAYTTGTEELLDINLVRPENATTNCISRASVSCVLRVWTVCKRTAASAWWWWWWGGLSRRMGKPRHGTKGPRLICQRTVATYSASPFNDEFKHMRRCGGRKDWLPGSSEWINILASSCILAPSKTTRCHMHTPRFPFQCASLFSIRAGGTVWKLSFTSLFFKIKMQFMTTRAAPWPSLLLSRRTNLTPIRAIPGSDRCRGVEGKCRPKQKKLSLLTRTNRCLSYGQNR